jgi:hypothetical protein
MKPSGGLRLSSRRWVSIPHDVEYLVTSKESKDSVDISKFIQFRDVVDDLSVLPNEILKLG